MVQEVRPLPVCSVDGVHVAELVEAVRVQLELEAAAPAVL